TDIFYAAITKTAGTWRHLKLKTVNLPLVYWMAIGSVPMALLGVWFLGLLKRDLGDQLDETVFAILAGCLLVVCAATLLRGLALACGGPAPDNAHGGRGRRRPPPPPQDRGGRHRCRDRLRDRALLGRQRDADRDDARHRLPPEAPEGRRHGRGARRDPALGGL